MTSQFSTTCRVEFSDTDMAGIVHFTNFYRYMEQVEHEYFRSLGLSIMHKQEDGSVVSWPRVSASCSFKAPAFYDDVLDVELTVVRKGVKSLTMKFEFRRDDTLVAHGQLKTVCCLFRRGEELKSIEIPAEYGEKIAEMDST